MCVYYSILRNTLYRRNIHYAIFIYDVYLTLCLFNYGLQMFDLPPDECNKLPLINMSALGAISMQTIS